MLDIIWQIYQQMKYLNDGKVIVYNDNMQLINKFNFGMMKSIEYAQEAVAAISEIISIVRKSPVRFVFQYTPSYIAKVSHFKKDPPIYLM